MERCGRLADLLTVPAGELLPHGLDHFPLPGDALVSIGLDDLNAVLAGVVADIVRLGVG
jgi:hypothetical protein